MRRLGVASGVELNDGKAVGEGVGEDGKRDMYGVGVELEAG